MSQDNVKLDTESRTINDILIIGKLITIPGLITISDEVIVDSNIIIIDDREIKEEPGYIIPETATQAPDQQYIVDKLNQWHKLPSPIKTPEYPLASPQKDDILYTYYEQELDIKMANIHKDQSELKQSLNNQYNLSVDQINHITQIIFHIEDKILYRQNDSNSKELLEIGEKWKSFISKFLILQDQIITQSLDENSIESIFEELQQQVHIIIYIFYNLIDSESILFAQLESILSQISDVQRELEFLQDNLLNMVDDQDKLKHKIASDEIMIQELLLIHYNNVS